MLKELEETVAPIPSSHHAVSARQKPLDQTDRHPKNLTFLAVLAANITIITVAAITYYPALYYDFVWDDFNYLSGNSYVVEFNWRNIQWMFTTFHLSNWHPVTWLSFAFDYIWQGGFNPWGFHLTNIILHSLNSIGLFYLTNLLLRIHSHGFQSTSFTKFDQPHFIAAFLAALLFSIHPQHVESVAWISERKDVLCQFFILLTLFFYIAYIRLTTMRWYWYFSALISFALALMSKPMAVTLPVVLLILDLYPLRRTQLLKPLNHQSAMIPWYKLLLEKIPFFTLTAIVIVLTLIAQQNSIKSLESLDPVYRVINAFHSIFLYISKFILPIALSPLYTFPVYIVKKDWLTIFTLFSGFILLTFLCIYYWKKNKPYFLASWLFYLVTLSPVIGIIQVGGQSAADRYTYLPTLPFYILIGSGIAYLYHIKCHHVITKSLFVVSIIITCLGLFKLNRDQLQIWKHGYIFWSYIITVDPANSFAQHNMAAYYFSYNDYNKALEHAKLAIIHGFPKHQIQGLLGEILIRLDYLDQALNAYRETLNADSSRFPAPLRKDCIRYNMGWIYAKKGLFDQAEQILLQIPSNSQEFERSQMLAIQIAMLNKTLTTNFPEPEWMKALLTIPYAKEIEQAKLDNLLAKQSYSFCFQSSRP